jgi:hypothetical protein
VATTVYLLNHSATKSVTDETPFEAWYGKKPAMHHLCTFGCVVHVKNTAPNLKKLDDQSKPMIFIGYQPGSKVYRAYDPVAKKVHVSRDMVFDEQAQWNWSSGGEAKLKTIDDSFTVEMEYTTTVQGLPLEEFNPWAPVVAAQEGSPEPSGSAASPLFSSGSVILAGAGNQEEVQEQSPLIQEEDLDVDHEEDAPLRVRNIHDIIGPATPRGLVPRVLADELHVVSSNEPSSFEDAEQDPCWRRAMLKEMKSIEDNGTWYLAD